MNGLLRPNYAFSRAWLLRGAGCNDEANGIKNDEIGYNFN
jgi:hypothetical protein